MDITLKKTGYCFLLTLLLTFLFNRYYQSKVDNPTYTLSVISTHEADDKFELYFDVGEGFNETHKLESNVVKGENTSVFTFRNKTFFKKFRLDFGDVDRVEEITINSIELQAENKEIFFLKETEIIKNIQFLSPNVEVQNNKLKIFKSDNLFDPYIEFKSLSRIIIPDWITCFILLLPFLIFYAMPFYQEIKAILLRKKIDLFFVILFLMSIPLKESLTTFIVLLWLGYIILILVRSRTIEINLTTFICLGLFLIPIIFGRPSSYHQINILLSFLIFGIISTYPLKRNFKKVRRVYGFIISIISLIVIASFLNYILYYAKYDDVSFYSYFRNIKYTNESIREWFGFSQPTYISIFSIVGMYFAFDSYKNGIIDKKRLILNILITFILVLVLGSRIAILVFVMIITAVVIHKYNYRKMLFIYSIIFGVGTLVMIKKIDPIRHQLWSISLDAIKEKPLFGFRLGGSENIILDKELNYNAFTTTSNLNHPHNQYISYVLEIGVLGFMVLIALLLILKFKYSQKINNISATLLFIWSILSLIESPFETSKPTFLFCFFLLISIESAIFKISIKSPFKILK
ncbi:MAG: O-antigen ligase family protein [Ferruginibacter sp.]